MRVLLFVQRKLKKRLFLPFNEIGEKSLVRGCDLLYKKVDMKKDIHPQSRETVFKDVSCGFQIITTSTVQTKNTIEIKGKTYPLVTFDVSSASHPFYTGQQRIVDTEGRAEKFTKKYQKFKTTSGKMK